MPKRESGSPGNQSPEFRPDKPDKRGRLYYTFDVPVIVMHKLLNDGEPTVARLIGGQRITGDLRHSITFESFAARLELPALMYGHERGYSRVGAMRAGVRMANAKEVASLDMPLGLDGKRNTAAFVRKTKRIVGQLVLKAELPFDAKESYLVVPFTCTLLRNGYLDFTATGTLLNGRYAGLILACCGIKTPAPPPPPPCVITIATTTRATATNTGGAMGFTGLVQTATSSVGHLFPVGKITVVVNVWHNGQSMQRPGVLVPLAANGTLTYPPFGVSFPATWPAGLGGTVFPPDAVVELIVTVTDVNGDVGTHDFARYGSDVP